MIQFGVNQRRFWWGLLLSLVLGIAIQQWLLWGARRSEAEKEERRVAVITVQALAEIVQRAGVEEEKISSAVGEFVKLHPELKFVRVIRGTRLIASTVPTDTGDKVAPRRLSMDEKWIYDTGQRLRAAVQTNLDEGGSRKDELEIVNTSGGGLQLSSPIEEDGAIVGYVQMETAPRVKPAPIGWLLPVALILVPMLIFTGICFFVKENRMALAVSAFVLLLLFLFLFSRSGLSDLEKAIAAQTKATAARIQGESKAGEQILRALSADTSKPLQPSRWDVDTFRRPRGMFSDTGTVDETKLQAGIVELKSQFSRALILVLSFSAVILALIGFGVVSKFIHTLVE